MTLEEKKRYAKLYLDKGHKLQSEICDEENKVQADLWRSRIGKYFKKEDRYILIIGVTEKNLLNVRSFSVSTEILTTFEYIDENVYNYHDMKEVSKEEISLIVFNAVNKVRLFMQL